MEWFILKLFSKSIRDNTQTSSRMSVTIKPTEKYLNSMIAFKNKTRTMALPVKEHKILF